MTTARAAVRVAVVARVEVKWAEAAWEMGGEATVAAWTAAWTATATWAGAQQGAVAAEATLAAAAAEEDGPVRAVVAVGDTVRAGAPVAPVPTAPDVVQLLVLLFFPR